MMRTLFGYLLLAAALALAAVVLLTAGQMERQLAEADQAMADGTRWSHQDWPTGHYQVRTDWPKPLPIARAL